MLLSYRENPFLNSPKDAQSLHEKIGGCPPAKKSGGFGTKMK